MRYDLSGHASPPLATSATYAWIAAQQRSDDVGGRRMPTSVRRVRAPATLSGRLGTGLGQPCERSRRGAAAPLPSKPWTYDSSWR